VYAPAVVFTMPDRNRSTGVVYFSCVALSANPNPNPNPSPSPSPNFA